MLDADRVALTDAPTSIESYIAYLIKLYGFDASLSSAFALVPGLATRLRLPTHCASLVDDLRALGFPLERMLEIPLRPAPRFRSLSVALGWVYVSEVSRASHQLIRIYVAKKLPVILRGSALDVERVTHDQWHQLGELLDEVASDEGAGEEIVLAAIDAFDAQHRWLRPGSPTASEIAQGVELARTQLRAGAARK